MRTKTGTRRNRSRVIKLFVTVFTALASAGNTRARPALPAFFILAIALLYLSGCASTPPSVSESGQGAAATRVQQRLAEILNAAETKDLARLDSYHWYGPHFTKFGSTGPRLDAASARAGEHKGLSALTGLKLRAEDLQIDVFDDTAVATFTMVATMGGIGGTSSASPTSIPVTKRERGTVLLRVLVDAFGHPSQIHVERSSGFDRLDNAARDAVAKALFRPHEVNGVAQPAQVLIPIEFTSRAT